MATLCTGHGKMAKGRFLWGRHFYLWVLVACFEKKTWYSHNILPVNAAGKSTQFLKWFYPWDPWNTLSPGHLDSGCLLTRQMVLFAKVVSGNPTFLKIPEVSRKDVSNVPKFGTFQTSFQSLGHFTHSEKTFQMSQTSFLIGETSGVTSEKMLSIQN